MRWLYTERYLIQRLGDLTLAVKGETHLPETIQNAISELHHSSTVKVTSALQGSELCATWIHFPNMNILSELLDWIKNQDGSVGMVTDIRGTTTGDKGSFLGRGKVFVSSPQDPEGFWGVLSFLSMEYRSLYRA